MKIAFLNIYQNSTDRGVEVFIKALNNNLSKKNDITVFSDNKKNEKRWPFLWRLYLDPNSLQILVFTLKCLPKIVKQNYDIVVPLNGGWQSLLIRILTWLTGKKMVIVGQSGIGWDDRMNIYCFPDVFVAISTKAEMWAKKINPLIKTAYIPNGVDLLKFKTEGSTVKLSIKKPIILCVGALEPEKRIDLVINAISRVEQLSLLVVGTGSLKSELKNLAENLIPGRYQFLEAPHHKMPEIYRSADLFTLVPAKSEAFGIVYVEAMASGLGIIAIDDMPRREIIGSAGLFVSNPENIDEYAETITHAIARKWTLAAVNQSKKFNWVDVSAKYQQLFSSLLN